MSVDTLANLEDSLRQAIRREGMDPVKQSRAIEIQKEAWGVHTKPVLAAPPAELPKLSEASKDDSFKSSEKVLKAKEEQIKKKKAEVEERVKAQLSRVESEAKKLDELKKELEGIEDPTKKEVADLRKKIEAVDRELRPLKALCERREKELKEATTAFNEKNAAKSELVGRLFEIVTESERMRLEKLDELNRLLQAMESGSSA